MFWLSRVLRERAAQGIGAKEWPTVLEGVASRLRNAQMGFTVTLDADGQLTCEVPAGRPEARDRHKELLGFRLTMTRRPAKGKD